MAEWFVAYVRSCQEKTVAARLASLAMEHYVPIRKERRRWSDRIVVKDRLLLPRVVFIHCTETERLGLFKEIPYLCYFMMDRLTKKPVTVPQKQMDTFRRVVDGSASQVEMRSSEEFVPGDKVRVIDGPLKDVECEVTSIKNKIYICVRLGMLGAAITEIGASQVIKID